MTDISGKVLWITGASGGIGEALALSASRRGAHLVLSARREAELQRVRQHCADPARIALLPLDLLACDPGVAAHQAASFFGPLDLLVNNAGISQRSRVLDTSMEVYRRLLELDFFVPVALSKAVLPSMVERRAGHIVTISSVVGKVATPLRSGYAAAKHALHGFHDALRVELHASGVKVTVICPGFVRTAVSLNAVTGDGRAQGRMDAAQQRGMDPQVCAKRVWRAVAANRSEALIGGRETLAVHLQRLSPRLLEQLLRRVAVT